MISFNIKTLKTSPSSITANTSWHPHPHTHRQTPKTLGMNSIWIFKHAELCLKSRTAKEPTLWEANLFRLVGRNPPPTCLTWRSLSILGLVHEWGKDGAGDGQTDRLHKLCDSFFILALSGFSLWRTDWSLSLTGFLRLYPCNPSSPEVRQMTLLLIPDIPLPPDTFLSTGFPPVLHAQLLPPSLHT